jgi:ribonuclease J
VVISHQHQDHYGLIDALPAHWPVWAGRGAAALMRLTAEMGQRPLHPIKTYMSNQPQDMGPFRVTPLAVDHSAFDAHMLLVEVGGKRILYSGDFRWHGHASGGAALAQPPAEVDLLLMEGTNLPHSEEPVAEGTLEQRFQAVFAETRGRVFVAWSSQNLDRTSTLLSACRETGRTLVVDLFTAEVLQALKPFAPVPVPGEAGLRVVVTRALARRYEKIGKGEFVAAFRTNRTGMGAVRLNQRPGSLTIMVRPSMVRDYAAKDVCPTAEDAWCFSQWRRYLDEPAWAPVKSWFDGGGTPLHCIHTSGHAGRSGLVRLVDAIRPRCLVPLHGEAWATVGPSVFPSLSPVPDGVDFSIEDLIANEGHLN